MTGLTTASPPSAFVARSLAPDPIWQATAGAFRATGANLGAVWGNPSVVAALPGRAIALSHLGCGEGVDREWLALASPLSSTTAVALDACFLHTAALPVLDAEGALLGSMQPSEWSVGGSSAWQPLREFSAGLGARYLRLEDPAEPLATWTVSAGLLLRGRCFALGLAANDLGPPVHGAHGTWSPPSSWVAGVEGSSGDGRWSLGASVSARPGARERLSLGLTIRPMPWLELLGGLSAPRSADEAGIGWGSGVSVSPRGIGVSYAVQGSEANGLIHQIGLTCHRRSAS